MKPADINKLVWAGEPALSPDATRVAYVVTSVDKKANRYRSRVWLTATDGSGVPRPVTAGEWDDRSPAWSPDGSALAFVTTRRNEADGVQSSLYVLSTDGPGEAALLAQHDEAITDVAFSPDGRSLAYVCRVRGDHYATEETSRRPPRRITRPFYRLNGAGVTIDRPRHLHVVAIDGSGDCRDLTPGDDEYGSPSWLPDSRRLVASRGNAGPAFLASDIDIVYLDGSAAEPLTDATGSYRSPAPNADGDLIALTGSDVSDSYPVNAHVGLIPSAGGPVTWISTGLDRTWEGFFLGVPPAWLDHETLVCGVQDRGNFHVRRLHTDGSAPEPLIDGDRTVTGLSVVDGTIAFTASTPELPAELFVIDSDGTERRLTTVTTAFTSIAAPSAAEHFLAPSGDVEVDAWIVRPADFDPSERYPMLFNIHGGPFTQYGNTFFDEAQIQAGAGYVVVMSNPRGSSGRHHGWGAAIQGRLHQPPGSGWGAVDFEDLMAVVDTAIELFPFIDPDRVGVLGGSYGGYMTSWIIGKTDRFVAACSERAVNNLLGLDMGSDTAGLWRVWFGASGVEAPEEYLRMSPITYVGDMTTPLLILHSDNDLRCPADQADQLFIELQARDREVEYHLFPDEDHELSRSGSPAHRVQRAELILEWFDRYLQPQAQD